MLNCSVFLDSTLFCSLLCILGTFSIHSMVGCIIELTSLTLVDVPTMSMIMHGKHNGIGSVFFSLSKFDKGKHIISIL